MDKQAIRAHISELSQKLYSSDVLAMSDAQKLKLYKHMVANKASFNSVENRMFFNVLHRHYKLWTSDRVVGQLLQTYTYDNKAYFQSIGYPLGRLARDIGRFWNHLSDYESPEFREIAAKSDLIWNETIYQVYSRSF